MKKKIPLTALETIQPIIDNNQDLITQISDDNSFFYLKDLDCKSDFFYIVVKQDINKSDIHYLVNYKPMHKDNLAAHQVMLKIEDVAQSIAKWLDIISTFNNIHTIYDDPILKSYEEKFLQYVDIVDEDANFAPFNLQQQIYLDEYLSTVDQKLEKFKLDRTEEEIILLNELQFEAKEIKKDITKLTKKKLIKRLARFWAKSQKIGLDVIKEIFVSVTAELTKRLLIGGN